ncbi:hypothetical protein ABEB36_005399 [Hypothenemus hampei]|uniref:Uncharacterized protein n=1 Tax=Hypothenemus hampei TaxID=57062 RepID=A0ABD1EY41_HYPHA
MKNSIKKITTEPDQEIQPSKQEDKQQQKLSTRPQKIPLKVLRNKERFDQITEQLKGKMINYGNAKDLQDDITWDTNKITPEQNKLGFYAIPCRWKRKTKT